MCLTLVYFNLSQSLFTWLNNCWEERGILISPAVSQLPALLPVNNYPFVQILCSHLLRVRRFMPTPVRVCVCVFVCVRVCVCYLEQRAVALQPGGAERGDRAQAAPEVDARQQRTVSQQQTGGSLQRGGGRVREVSCKWEKNCEDNIFL